MSEPQADRRLITVVVPALNEADNIERLYDRVANVFTESLETYDWELVITDNRSSDETFAIAQQLSQRDPRVRAYRFSKNFGYQRSILTGYALACGDAVVQLDADMQDPPELIPKLIEQWEAGAKVVYGVRVRRHGENPMLTGIRKVFYRLIDWLSDEDLPRDAGDFRLVDGTIAELLKHNHDSSPYLRGAIASMGFEQVGFEYERADRVAGTTKFRFRSLVQLAVDGILNHSTRPLQLASLTAAFIVIITVIGMGIYASARLFFGQDWPAGFASLALLQLVGIMLNAAFLGIIGAYLGRMFKQSKPAPIVIIEQSTAPDTRPTVLTSAPPLAQHSLTPRDDKDHPNHE